MEESRSLESTLKTEAIGIGFSHCGITSANPLHDEQIRYEGYLAKSFHARMDYLERSVQKRFHPSLFLEGAKSVICLAFPYGDAETAKSNKTGIALYAWGEDYHSMLEKRAGPLIGLLKKSDPKAAIRFCVDHAPLAERSLAVRAGLGWIGKNGLLITPERGSMVYLAEIITSIPLREDNPYAEDHCGECSLCIHACPVSAISGNKLVNSRKCIAFHTNTSKEPIPVDIAMNLGGRIFGCDICQQVCPWNSRDAFTGNRKGDEPVFPVQWPKGLREWAGKDEAWFKQNLTGSALEHTGYKKIRANVLTALHFSGAGSPQENEGK